MSVIKKKTVNFIPCKKTNGLDSMCFWQIYCFMIKNEVIDKTSLIKWLDKDVAINKINLFPLIYIQCRWVLLKKLFVRTKNKYRRYYGNIIFIEN